VVINIIVLVADVFDSLLSKRPYKDAWFPDKTIEWIKNQSGEHFDPKVINAFLRAIPELLKIHEKLKD